MKLSEKKGGDFTPHPETEGTVKAVIVDVTPLKKVQSEFGERDVFRLVFETEVTDDEGKRFCIWSRPYTPSLNEKANFRKDVKKLLGRDLTAQELSEFDTESLINIGVLLIVQQEEGKNGQTYSVISFLAPDKTGKTLKSSASYKRVKDREPRGDDATSGGGSSYRNAPKAAEGEGRADWQKTKVHVGKHAGVDLGDMDEAAVKMLIEKWLPEHKANAKPKADDKRLGAALEEVASLLGIAAPTSEPTTDY
ncbi:MAG: hypothetical protein V4733_03640 [Verrucomicrobiota bacterium]